MYQVIFLSLLFIVVGCSTSKETIFKENMPTMKEVYEEKFNPLNDALLSERPLNRPVTSDHSAMPSYEALRHVFPKAPNPTMVIHVFSHLTASGTPVPGYNTYFTLYRSDHFIMPTTLNQ